MLYDLSFSTIKKGTCPSESAGKCLLFYND
jgi:hypothetical protein